MTRVYRRVTPADVLHMAGESPADVPQLLAEMSDGELGAVRELGGQVVRYVDEVMQNRKFQQIWREAGRQTTVVRENERTARDVWNGVEPSWPTDESVTPPVPQVAPGAVEGDVPAAALAAIRPEWTPPPSESDGDAERTQIIDAASITAMAAAGQYEPVPASAVAPAPRKPRPVPVVMDPGLAAELADAADTGSAPERIPDVPDLPDADAPDVEGTRRWDLTTQQWDGRDWSAITDDEPQGDPA